MYEVSSQSHRDQFWLNVGIMILIAGLFVAGLYYYQQKQLSQLRNEVKDLKAQLTTDANFNSENKNPEKINQEQIITSGSKDLPKIALTFDADMTSSMSEQRQWYDPQIIELLEEKEVPATFFLTGMWAETYPETAKQLANNGLFQIESHSYQTKAFSRPCYELNVLKNEEEKKEAIEKAQQAIKNVTGVTPNYFRFPGGCYQEEDLKLVNEAGLKAVQWDVVSGDAFADSSSFIVNKTLNNTQNGSIVIFHLGGPNAPYTAPALKEIIPKLREKGYQFTTLHSLLNPLTVPSK